MNEEYIIKKAEIKDIDDIMLIEHDAFIPEICENRETFIRRINVFKDGFYLLIDSKNNKICGYMCTEIWNKEPVNNLVYSLGHDITKIHDSKGTVLYISSVALLKEYRGKFLGKYLFRTVLDAILTEFILINKIILLVNSLWISAQHIYNDSGFECYDVIKDFFRNQTNEFSDGILMQKGVRR